MIIYKNEKNTKFMSVTNDDYVDLNVNGYKICPDLYDDYGIHLYPQDNDSASALWDVIQDLSLNDRDELLHLLQRDLNDKSEFSLADVKAIIMFFDKTLDSDYWHSWYIPDGDQTGYAWVYSPEGLLFDPNSEYKDDGKSDYFGKNWQEIIVFARDNSRIVIQPSDQNGKAIGTESKESIFRRVAGLDETNQKQEVDAYMKATYGMVRV